MAGKDLGEVVTEAAQAIRRAVEAHEAEDHAGELCPEERYGALAFVAHVLGFAADRIGTAVPGLRHKMALAEARCEGCAHMRN